MEVLNMGYSFMTLEKIKNMNQIIGKYKHNYREIDVLNADPSKKDLNEELVKLDGKTFSIPKISLAFLKGFSWLWKR